MKTTRLLAVGGSRPAAVDRFLTNRSGGPGPPRCPMPFTTPRQFVGGQWRAPFTRHDGARRNTASVR
jgi:hypothetical protein